MAVKIAPSVRQQFLDANGNPYVGYKLFTYSAGSSTKQATYTSSTGLAANTNPIILDSAGRTPFGLWLTAGLNYKFVLALATDTDPPTSPVFTEDVIAGVNDTGSTTSQWQAAGVTPTYISATQFSLIGDKTADFQVGRRLKFTVAAGTVYGRITASAYATLTTVTVSGGTLDSGLSTVELSILTAANHALPALSAVDLSALGIQASDTQLDTLAAITAQQAADLAALSAYAGTLLNDADAATARATLGVVASSETASGLIEIATSAEAQAQTDAVRAITPAALKASLQGANQSLAATGYQKFPGGLVIQWGVFSIADPGGASQVVTFPIAFISSILHASVCVDGAASQQIGTTTRTLSQMTITKGASDVAARTGLWAAIGV